MLALIITILIVVLISVYTYRSWNRLRTFLGGSPEQRRESARRRRADPRN